MQYYCVLTVLKTFAHRSPRFISVTGMQTRDDIAKFLQRQPHIMTLLAAVWELGIEDCWVGAGLIRNAVWNYHHGFPTDPVPGSDVDVVYCDSTDASQHRDLSIEARLLAKHPHVRWSVHNQARMHVRNGSTGMSSMRSGVGQRRRRPSRPASKVAVWKFSHHMGLAILLS
jgi:hypothetical protein